MPSYERQPGEPSTAWSAFQCYRDAGPGRSLSKVAAALKRSKRLVERWCSRWAWVSRCAAWDAEQDRLAREAFTKARLEKIQHTVADLELFQGLARRRFVELAKRIQEMPEAIEGMDLGEARVLYLEAEKLKRVLMGEPAMVEETRHAGPEGQAVTITVEQIVAARQRVEGLRQSRLEGKRQHNGQTA